MDKHHRGGSGNDSDPSTSYVSTYNKKIQSTIRELQKRYKSYDVDRARERVVHGVVRGAACGMVRCLVFYPSIMRTMQLCVFFSEYMHLALLV